MGTLIQDLRYGLRELRQSPAFTAVAVITLALGVGAPTAIFTLVQQVMFRSLPVAQPSQLWRIGDTAHCCFSWQAYNLFRANTPAFQGRGQGR